MSGMPMGGSGAMSMMWTPMPGQSWAASLGSFVGMWLGMTAAMMLPSFLPALWRYRTRVGDRLAALMALGYSAAWLTFGVAVFPLGAALAVIESRLSYLAPIATGLLVVLGSLIQISPWKARSLARCRATGGSRHGPATPRAHAWRDGVQLGIRCACSCSGLMMIQLAVGLMDHRAMAVVTVAITAERLAPAGQRVARIPGGLAVATGVTLLLRAVA
jgi:predicted metal-binding membrane protein